MKEDILNTGIYNVKNPSRYIFGEGSIKYLESIIDEKRSNSNDIAVVLVDEYFEDKQEFLNKINLNKADQIKFISTKDEPTTEYVDQIVAEIKNKKIEPCAIIGIGGGSTLDIAKAISNLLTNPGVASDYQGWDLLKNQGIYKIGIPTLSGTGSESTRTCVMTNKTNNLKLGMNSDYSIFDQLILDPELTRSVPRDQYFYSGMDSYIHCIESLNGNYRNQIGDSYSEQVKELCKSVFLSDDMQSDENRSKLMVASYLGGCAIATSYVGLIHPFSAGLSIALGYHHCIANCIAFGALDEFYPEEHREFKEMLSRQSINLPKNISMQFNSDTLEKLYLSTIIHEKPLFNALGSDFKNLLNRKKVDSIFMKM